MNKPSPGPSWSVSPKGWGARVNYDSWTDTYTPDDAIGLHHGGPSDYAAGRAPYSTAKEMQLLRSWETYHLDTKKWRGFAYGWALGQTGAVYRGRGWNTYGAHTGDLDADHISNNEEVIPVVFLGSGSHHSLTNEAQSSLVRLRQYYEDVTGRQLRLYGHQELRGISTTCPGPKLMSYVVNNRYLTVEEDMELSDQVKISDGNYITLELLLSRVYRNVNELTVDNRSIISKVAQAVWHRPVTDVPDVDTNKPAGRLLLETRSLASKAANQSVDVDEQAIADAVVAQINDNNLDANTLLDALHNRLAS